MPKRLESISLVSERLETRNEEREEGTKHNNQGCSVW
jgi:hypothetical protein